MGTYTDCFKAQLKGLFMVELSLHHLIAFVNGGIYFM
jgi:hypothetical protein